MTNKPKQKNKRGQPTKLTPHFIEVAKEVLFDDINAIIFTDEELVNEINDRLKEKERITQRTMENWKAKIGNEKEGELDEIGKEFFRLIKRALQIQKKNLFSRLSGDDKAWQRFAWIIERKFDDWNIRHKTDFEGKLIGEIKTTKYVPGKKK